MVDLMWTDKLRPMVDRDLVMKNILLEKGVLSDHYHPELEKIQILNAQKLAKLIEKMGFPVISNAGEEGVRLSWLIIHNAISCPDFMRECLVQMRLAAADQDYVLELLAYTEDRVAFYEGRPQPFGTNLDWEDGELRPTPIESPNQLDLRRKSMSLQPFSAGNLVTTLDRPPKDPIKRHLEFQGWLQRVGWRI